MDGKANNWLRIGILIPVTALLIGLYGCGKPELGSVDIDPEETTLTVGESVTFNAVPLSTEDEEMEDVSVQWRVEGEAGSIDSTGAFTAEQPGQATVIAEADGISNQATVTVEAPAIADLKLAPETAETLPESTVKITVAGATQEGQPAGYHEVQVSTPTEGAQVGTETVTLKESGEAEFEVTMPPTPGKTLVTASVGDVKADTEIEVRPRPVAKIEVQPESEQALAESEVTVQVSGLGEKDQAAAMNRVTVSSPTEGVQLSTDELTLDEQGRAQFQVTLSPGKNRIILKSGDTTQEVVLEGTQVERIEITPEKDQFEVGQEIDFQAVGYDQYDNQISIEAEWSLSGENAALEEDGVVKMESPGNAILFARYGEISQGHPFSIVPGRVAKITVEPQEADLKAGQSLSFDAEAFNAYGYPLTPSIQWKTEGDIGAIAEDGTFLAETVGEGQVIAASGEVTASVPVQVAHGALSDITIDLEQTTFTAGEKVQLSAQGVDAYGNKFPISPQWFLSASLGKVDQEASEFMPLRTGAGEILAKEENVVTGVDIEVVPAEPARLLVEPPAVDVIAGNTVQFEVTGYDKFDNVVEVDPEFSIREDLGDIDATGVFTAETSGSTIVEAKAEGLTGESTVAVAPAEMQDVELTPQGPMEVTAGKAENFSASGYDAYGNTVKAEVAWDMHPDLGMVDSRGVFSPEKAGKTRLTATVHQLRTGKKIEVGTEVSVVPGETTQVQIEPDSVDITAGEEVVFSAVAYDKFQNKTEVDINWQVEPSTLGNVNQEGRFSAVTAESGQILARHGGVVASAAVEVQPAEVAFLKIIPEEITATAGEMVDLQAVMEDRFGNVVKGDVSWDLSDEALAEITDQNELIAKKAGEGRLIAAAYNIAETAPLTVKKGSLDSIELTPTEKTVSSGSTVEFDAVGYDAGGNELSIDFNWAVDDAIGEISDDGAFTAVKVGSGKVTVSREDIGASASVKVTPGAPADITLEPESFTITAGKTQPLTYEVRDANGNLIPAPDIQWEIPDNIGSVDDQNRFKARKAGQGPVKLLAGDAAAQSSVTVETGPIHTVTIEPTSADLRAGEHQGFTAEGFDSQGNPLDLEPAWSASGDIGTVNKAGNFKAITEGAGFVTVRMEDATAVARVRVSPGPVDRVAVSPENLVLQAGSEAEFSAVAYDAYDNVTPAEISWSLDAEDGIGELTDEAIFQARSTGQGAVVATTDDVEGRSKVVVAPGGLAEIVLSPEEITLRSGETADVKATGRDAYGNEREIEPNFTLNPASIGDIDAAGRLTAQKADSGRLIVSADGVEAEAPVTVEPGPLTSLEVRLPEETLRAGNTYSLEIIGYDPGGNEVPAEAEWSVSQNIGRIDEETGRFSARTAGSGLVVASTDDIVAKKIIEVESGKLYSLYIEPNPVTVNSDTTQQFEVSGVDVEENPVSISNAAVEWEAVGGIGGFEDPGLFRGTRMGRGKVVARIGDLLAEAYVTVVPGKPEPRNSRIRVTYPTLPADGESFSEVILEVRDEYSNPVPGVRPTIVSSRQVDNVVQPGDTNKEGLARGRISSGQPGQSVIRAVVDGTPFVDTARITFE
ncbi:MAG: Ig-like domain-containing protein [Thermodesulfobacteriota bacterium]